MESIRVKLIRCTIQIKNSIGGIWFLFIATTLNAQTAHRSALFKLGDKYQNLVYTKSNTTLQRGVQTIDLKVNLSVTRSYLVIDTPANAYTFKIITEKITDTLKGAGQQMEYDSDKPIDQNSTLEKIMKRMIGKPTEVLIDKTGKIIMISKKYFLSHYDSLMVSSGLLYERLIAGNIVELVSTRPVLTKFKKGDKWTDTLMTTEGKDFIHYTVDFVTDSTATVNFKGSGLKDYAYSKNQISIKDHFSSIIEGYLIVDINTNIIKKRFTKTDSYGYESINGVSFSTQRKQETVEIIKKQ